MSRCPKCNVKISDKTIRCPLCGHVLAKEEGLSGHDTYPKLAKKLKKRRKAMSIYLAAAVAAAAICIYIDFYFEQRMTWSVVVVDAILYGMLTMWFSCIRHMNYRGRFILQTIAGLGFIICIDIWTGFAGWSLMYVTPGAFIFMDVGISAMLLINIRNWQSYMPLQMLMIVLCAIPYLLNIFLPVETNIFNDIAIMVSTIAFVATLLIGGKRARDELKRRFYA